MKKVKFLSLLVLVVSMLAVCFFTAEAAETFTENGYTYQKTGTDSVTIVGIDSTITGDVVIPATLGGYKVRNFGEAFKGKTAITSITLPEGISSIAYYAFNNCKNLEYVYISSTVTYVSSRAFDNTSSLKRIEVSESSSSFCSENGVLYNKAMTELIAYPAACEIKSFDMPDSVISVNEYSFANGSLEEITFSDACVQVGRYAFYSNSKLVTVNFNDAIQTIGDNAFASCRKLENMTLPSTLTEIKTYTFAWCDSLKEIIIPEGVKTIAKKGFYSCDGATLISISSTVESIGALAFDDYSRLEKITVAENNSYFTADENGILFNKDKTELIKVPECNGITEYSVPGTVLKIADNALSYNKTLTTINFPADLKSIGEKAFYCSYYITGDVYIPASVEYIGEKVFYQCNYITAINVDNANQWYSSDEYGALYDKNKTTLIVYPPKSTAKEYVVPDTVIIIADHAIGHAVLLDSIVIPDSVTTLEDYSIYSSSLSEIIIGSGLSEININAFSYTTIKDISVSEENEYFCSVDGALYDKDMTILYKFPSYQQRVDFVVPDTVKKIINGAFYQTNIENIIFTNSVSEIGYSVFDNCYNLKTITVVNPNASISSFRKGVVYYGYANSTLEKYCRNGGYDFVPLYDGLSVDYEDGVLILSGTSELPVIDNDKMCPWAAFAESTDCILIRDISLINADAFSAFYNISSVIFESENITVADNAFADCHKLKTVICYSDAEFGEATFSAQTENLLFFKENNKNIISNYDFITFTYEDGIVSFDKPVTIEHYDFFNLVVALCSRYPVVNEFMFNEFTLLNGNLELVTDEERIEISSFTNDRLAVQILDEETWDLVTVSFTELCEGVANGKINAFVLVVIDENDEIQDSTEVDSEPGIGIDNIVTYILRAIITFFNKLLNLFR